MARYSPALATRESYRAFLAALPPARLATLHAQTLAMLDRPGAAHVVLTPEGVAA